MQTTDGFSADVICQMQENLTDVRIEGPAEILWVGQVNAKGCIVQVSVAARGTVDAVPALFPHMTRGDVVIHNHPGGNLRPSDADLCIASRLGNQGIGFIIVDDAVNRMYVVAAPIPKQDLQLLDAEALVRILEPGGALSAYLGGYESRLEQIAMLRDVVTSFNAGQPMIAEAGTGIGKSFAYLLPALMWASMNDERIVVSTATIALQQQLMDKDIPMALQILGNKVSVALVKGRGNYLCLKRLTEAGTEEDLFGVGEELAALRRWADESSSGERSDIPFYAAEPLWNQVRCESDSCPGPLCHFFEKCFLMRARRRASEASLLVSNHHLLFADLAARLNGVGNDASAVLPPYKRIVLDEAHHIESSATALFSISFSLRSLNRIFYRLFRKKGHHIRGLLQRLADKNPALAKCFRVDIPPMIEAARDKAKELDIMGMQLLRDVAPRRLMGAVDVDEKKYLLEPMDALRTTLVKLTGTFTEAIRELSEETLEKDMQALVVEAQQSAAGLQDAMRVADSFLNRLEFPEEVFWLEASKQSDGSKRLVCHRTPLSVAAIVHEAMWEPFETVVSVSATLAVADNFQHWKNRVGADRLERKYLEGIFPSPFDFASRVMLGIPNDAPTPENTLAWGQYLIDTVAHALEVVGGHALVLFTSYETLKNTIAGIRPLMGNHAPLLLVQGDDDRGRLLQRFRETSSSVLFATDSFWEGVDVPGASLRLVIITRLPFRPPSNPVTEARREVLEAAGGNAFMELTVPDAVTRFRQGFGRLMRRQDDHGAVLVLDSRIVRKRYGQLFVHALPPTFKCIKTTTGVLRDLERFIFAGNALPDDSMS